MLTDLLVTRLPNGVTNQAPSSIFASVPFPLALNYHVFDEDFYTYTASQWTVTETQSGATQGVANPGNGGILALVNSAADDDLNAIQRVAGGISGESWLLDPDKKFFASFRFNVDDATDSDIVIGLQITDTTPLAVSDGIFLRKSDGDATLQLVAVKDSVEKTLNLVDLEDALITDDMTQVDLFYDGQGSSGRLYAAVNGTVVGYMEPGASFPDDEALTVSIAVQNGEAAAKTLWVDRFYFGQEI